MRCGEPRRPIPTVGQGLFRHGAEMIRLALRRDPQALLDRGPRLAREASNSRLQPLPPRRVNLTR
jgi:hypothetical protein